MGLLSDIEVNLTNGNVEVVATEGNNLNSNLRRILNISSYYDDPFSSEDTTLIVRELANVPVLNLKNDTFADIIGTNLEKIVFNNRFTAICSGVSLTGDNFTKKLVCNSFDCIVSEVSDIDIECNSEIETIPQCVFQIPNYHKRLKLTNVNIEQHSKRTIVDNIRISTTQLPVFKNVTSKTIRKINIYDNSVVNDAIFNTLLGKNTDWTNFFEFGHSVMTVGTKISKMVNVDSFETLYKMVAKERDKYDECPYRIKKDAKLSDLIDITGFENFESLNMYDKNVGILFTKDINCCGNLYYDDALKGEGSVKEFIENLPTTNDGYKVIIYRF